MYEIIIFRIDYINANAMEINLCGIFMLEMWA